jgi:hypothetical protein
MTGSRRTKLVATGGGLAALVLSAAALAQTDTFAPREESEALLADVAEQLGVEPGELTDALREAYTSRIDRAVEDGRLTAEQADALKERLEAGDVPLLMGPWGGHGPGHGFHGGGLAGGLDAAAEYLGLSEGELRTALEEGDTLAEAAEAQDKPVEGLVDAMVAAARADLDEAVEEGRITEEMRDSMLSTLEERIRDHVNEGSRHLPGGHGHRGSGPFFGSGDAA